MFKFKVFYKTAAFDSWKEASKTPHKSRDLAKLEVELFLNEWPEIWVKREDLIIGIFPY